MSSPNRAASRTSIATQLILFLAAVTVLVPAVSPSEAVGGGVLVKAAFIARIAALVALAHWLLRRRSLDWSDLGLRRPDWLRFAIALPAGLLMTFAFGALGHVLIVNLGLRAPDYSMFAPIAGNLGEYLFWLLPVSVGTAAFGEELIFRGFITESLQRLMVGPRSAGAVVAITVQAGIFGCLHFYQGAGGMITAGATGLALGLTWLIAARNLWAGIATHALLDGSAMTAVYLGYTTT